MIEESLERTGARYFDFYLLHNLNTTLEPYFDKYAKGIAEHMPARGGVDIHDCTFNVRKEGDIRSVAHELNTLINRQTNGGLA